MDMTLTLRPYKYYSQWVFDDPQKGLTHEAFVRGADRLIELVTARFAIKNPEFGFLMTFSDQSFPTAQVILKRVGPDDSGTIYEWEGHSAWLCPSLNLYFPEPPELLYVQVEDDPDSDFDFIHEPPKSRMDYWDTVIEKIRDQA